MSPLRAFGLLTFVGGFLFACKDSRVAPFPQVDRDKLEITLIRSACYGTCPDYKVTINGHGRVVFSTRKISLPGAAEDVEGINSFPYVVASGRHEYDVDRRRVDALLEKFRQANFFALKDEYSAQITDNPTYVLEVDTGNGRKRILDYVGKEAGMPVAVSKLEDAVDAIAQTGRWVHGANGLVASLDREGFNFRSEEAARMLVRSIESGGDQTHLDLVSRGAPLGLPGGVGPYRTKGLYGSIALLTALWEGRAPLLRKLVRLGWLKRTDSQEVANAFAESAAGCSSDLVDVAVAAGISANAESRPEGNIIGTDGSATALASLGNSWNCDTSEERIRTARRLLAHGANPNQRDKMGQTPIFGIEDVGLLNLLFANGADAAAVDKEGNSAVFSSWNDEIVLRLLKAGASPKGSYDGKTLWDEMKEHPMPKVKAWLAAHPAALSAAKSK